MKTMLETRPGPPGTSPRARARDDLRDDLGRGQVPGQPGLAGRAERAGHPAARLGGHAHRDPLRIAHQDGLDERAVEGPPQRLAGHPLVAGQFLLRGEQPGQQAARQLIAGGGWQVGHVRRVIGQPREVVPGQLISAERRAAQLSGGGAALGRIQVSQMPGRSGGGCSARHLRSVGRPFRTLNNIPGAAAVTCGGSVDFGYADFAQGRERRQSRCPAGSARDPAHQ
jgi:hypothetical protein